MTKYQLIYPMAFYVFYMFALAALMFMSRVQALKKREVGFGYFKTYSGSNPQEKMLVIGRHYDNQFQVPILFLATCAVFMALDQASYFTLILAWGFVLSRLGHSWIHLGSNNVKNRAAFFGLGWFIILVMWGQLIWQALMPELA
ncbi:MAPEG family protein [Pseudobdellovibrio exovorus]|uniref:MAPEG family protein n=1 Tax=Pseudobdellovibrio exovorus JSS TaxID=1184267 RepID=M4V7G8_9BACT|nr:MAPEG family protein [Pseudobdellovibrio exovorus]AGH94380.1 hypothetical protein A11Q_160 [Pseudobdellovibrio exovorus JSS]